MIILIKLETDGNPCLVARVREGLRRDREEWAAQHPDAPPSKLNDLFGQRCVTVVDHRHLLQAREQLSNTEIAAVLRGAGAVGPKFGPSNVTEYLKRMQAVVKDV